MEILVEKFRKKYNLSADDAYTLVSQMEKVCYKKKVEKTLKMTP